MKKIMLTVALAAATLGANAQDYTQDYTDDYTVPSEHYLRERSFRHEYAQLPFAVMLKNTYSYNQLLWMVQYAYCFNKNHNDCEEAERLEFLRGGYHDPESLLYILTNFYYFNHNVFEKAKEAVDAHGNF